MIKLQVCLPDGGSALLKVEGASITSFHFDGMDQIPGHKSHERASDVGFNEKTQMWVATIRKPFRKKGMPYRFSHKQREKCIAWEQRNLN